MAPDKPFLQRRREPKSAARGQREVSCGTRFDSDLARADPELDANPSALRDAVEQIR